MKKVSVSLTERHVTMLDDRGERENIDSRSEALRSMLDELDDYRMLLEEPQQEYDTPTRLEALRALLTEIGDVHTEYEDLRTEYEQLEKDLRRVRNEKKLILQDREEKKELVKYAEERRTAAQRKAEASLPQRAKWWLFGMNKDEE